MFTATILRIRIFTIAMLFIETLYDYNRLAFYLIRYLVLKSKMKLKLSKESHILYRGGLGLDLTR